MTVYVSVSDSSVQGISLQNGIYILRKAHELFSLHPVSQNFPQCCPSSSSTVCPIETGLKVALSCLFKGNHPALPLSGPLSQVVHVAMCLVLSLSLMLPLHRNKADALFVHILKDKDLITKQDRI